jgi:aldose 1-epimerase
MNTTYGWQNEPAPPGDSLPPDRRRRGLATEPMSCAANAFNSGEGLDVLSPGAYVSGSWTLRTLT